MIPRYTRPQMGAIWSEERKFATWLQVELAVCAAWAEHGKVPAEDMAKLREARTPSLERIAEIEREIDHDLNAFLMAVAEQLGDESRFLHLGLTSYDVEDTATGIRLRDAADLLLAGIDALSRVLEAAAVAYKDLPQIGRTHGVQAEPISFGYKLLVWVDEMRRNRQRLAAARAQVAVGKISGAVGTHANVPPAIEDRVCASLGLAVAPTSTQIIQRDRHADFVTTLAVIAASLEKFATEIRNLQRTEVLEVEEPFEAGRVGSSAMPHKRNPARCERICGLARLLRSYALTALENVALWHERDITNSAPERVVLPDSCIILDYMLDLFTRVMADLRVYPANMARNLAQTRGLVYSEGVLLALIDTGLTRQAAYAIVQEHATAAWETGADFGALLKGDARVRARLDEDEIDALFDARHHLRNIAASYERMGLS